MSAPTIKRGLFLILPVCLAVLCGCAHQYLLRLNDGDQLISSTKPKSQGTNYHFVDITGVAHRIPKSRVVKIQSITVVNDEQEPPPPTKPRRQRHWYFLWLA